MYESLLSTCRLCPRQCGVNRLLGETGFCGAGRDVKIARADLHYWEEPPISGKGGSGAVFFSHCPMQCVYCQNYEISTLHKGKTITESKLSKIFLDLQARGALNINLVTPTHYVPQIIRALAAAKAAGLTIPIVYNCGGYESVETIRLLAGWVDIYLPDMKYFSDALAQTYSHAPGYFAHASAAIAEMFRQVGRPVLDGQGIMRRGIIVRHMLLPGRLFDSKKIIDYLYNTYHNDIYISIMNQYTPLPQASPFPELCRPVSAAYYQALVDYAAGLGVENAFIQESGTVGESFIPAFYNE